VTRTDAGATTRLMSKGGESSKHYAPGMTRSKSAEQLKPINTVDATAAKALPPSFPLHTTTEMDAGNFANPRQTVTTPMRLRHANVLLNVGRSIEVHSPFVGP
jgi:hypothetical protein